MRDNKVFNFLSKIAVHNDREWFAEHKEEYLESKEIFEKYVTKAIAALATLEPGVARLTPKECCYRFYRDTRFSTDKSPYKRHFGAYICTKGRKALRGGTYIHLQPGSSMFAFGPWWLPTNILTSCRNEILGNEEEWRKAVENDEFIRIFGHPGAAQFSFDHLPDHGFGIEMLKTAPKGFPRHSPLINYLRMKDYCCWVKIADDFLEKPQWEEKLLAYARVAKPMVDFANAVIDDYE